MQAGHSITRPGLFLRRDVAPSVRRPSFSANRFGRDFEAEVLLSPATLLRWQKESEFDTAYREAKRAAFSQSMARLHQMASAAVTTLGKALVDPNTPPATRVRAADSILDHTAKAIELEDLEARLAQLERSAEILKITSGK